jgi:purine-binding chemotaxis protein CheW
MTTIQVARFHVGDEEYALDIMRIKEIINPAPITRVPRAPAFIEGIIELRGAFLPVVDLRKRFGLDPRAAGRETKYVIVSLEGRIVGLIVDRVTEVSRIANDDIGKPPPMAVGDEGRFFSGVVKTGDRILLMLDLDAVLSSAERAQLRGLEQVDT